jgi:AcrR family transcriptional regulator
MARENSKKGRSGPRTNANSVRPESADIRERIIDCATDLLGREGYGAMSVSAICKLAEVSAPTIYWHFGNKEGLLAAVLKRSLKRDADAFLSIDIAPMTRQAAFEAYLGALRRVIISERPNNWVILSSLSEARHAAPEIVAIIAEARRRQVDFNAEQLRTLWGLRNDRLFVHLWIAYCNYLSLLYQDTKSEELVDAAIQSFRSAYYLLVAALGEEGAHESGFVEILQEVGYKPLPASSKPAAGRRRKLPSPHKPRSAQKIARNVT